MEEQLLNRLRLLQQIRKNSLDEKFKHYKLFAEFVDYLDSSCLESKYHIVHYLRLCQTFGACLANLKEFENRINKIKVLETGGLSVISNFFKELGGDVSDTKSDLRDCIDAEDQEYDLVLSLEVLEHIKDFHERNLNEIVIFNKSGAIRYADEIFRVLKPEGHLILTTPNPNSLKNIMNIVEDKPVFIFDKHVREYTRSEIEEIFGKFNTVFYETNYAFFFPQHKNRMDIKARLGEFCGPLNKRGDDHVFIFKK